MIIKHACGHEVDVPGDFPSAIEEAPCRRCLLSIRLEKTARALGCAMARNYIHSDAGVKQWAAKSVELAKALLAELDEAAK